MTTTDNTWVAPGAEVFISSYGVTPIRDFIERLTQTQVILASGRKFRNDGKFMELGKTTRFSGMAHLAPLTDARLLVDEAESACRSLGRQVEIAAAEFTRDPTSEALTGLERATAAAKGGFGNLQTAKTLRAAAERR